MFTLQIQLANGLSGTYTCPDLPLLKSEAGRAFSTRPDVRTVRVMDENSQAVLLLEKDAQGHCTNRLERK
jgi:hypothetical protein